MYKSYFGFTRYPFSDIIAPENVFIHHNFKEFKQRMDFLKEHTGIGALFGDTGMGKTLSLHWLAHSVNKNMFRPVHHRDVPQSVSEFYKQLLLEMGVLPSYRRSRMFRQIQEYIHELSQNKKIVPLIILDDCQLYPHSVLEALRLIFNFRFDSKAKYILLLSGQTAFLKRLQFKVYDSLTQRIIIHHLLFGFSLEETGDYLKHHLSLAGLRHQVFEDDAIYFIHQVTNGNPCKINQIAIRSLIIGAGKDKNSINKDILQLAVRETLWASATEFGGELK